MLFALDVDIYEPGLAHAGPLRAYRIDCHDGEHAYPCPRHVFYGRSDEEAEMYLDVQLRNDSWLRTYVDADAFAAEWKRTQTNGPFPMVRPTFFGSKERDLWESLQAHMVGDSQLREAVRKKVWEGVPMRVETIQRTVMASDLSGLRVGETARR